MKVEKREETLNNLTGKVIVEVKAVSALSTIHQAQLMSYLKLSGCRVGLLINFHTEILSKGIMRLANNF